jgi:hypothetical protein
MGFHARRTAKNWVSDMSLVGRKVMQRRRQVAKEDELRHIFCERLARGQEVNSVILHEGITSPIAERIFKEAKNWVSFTTFAKPGEE